MAQNLLIISSVIWIYVTIGFVFAVLYKRNDIADVMWGGGIFLASATAVATSGHTITSNPVAYYLCFLILIWSCRLTWQIGNRFTSKQKEDFRYAEWRRTWSYFYLRSYMQVFLLQGFLMIVVAVVVPSVATLANDPTRYNKNVLIISTAIFVAGLICETVADFQLNAFVRAPQNKGKIMMTGLWKFSRHPNYFGEVTAWWGLFLIASSLSIQAERITNVPMLLFALLSPITITYLILNVSGIPMLEAKYVGNPEFDQYKQRTSAFIPWFPVTPVAGKSV